MENWKKRFIILCSLIIIGCGFVHTVYADNPTDTPTPTVIPTDTPTPDNSQTISDLQNKINDLQNKINDLQGQERTLSSQITVMDNQITLTEYKIASTKQQIISLEQDIDTASKKISQLQDSVDVITKLLMQRIVATYEAGTQNSFQVLLSSSDITDYAKKTNYLRLVQDNDRKLVFSTVQAKDDYQNQKQILEDKKQQIVALQQQLENYTNDLNTQKSQKQSLLAETQGSEENYQQLLSRARAQLASLSNFGISASGGVDIIPHAELSDDWGKYYNQRDVNWGNVLINGQSSGCGSNNNQPCTVWMVGCLITSYAMVVSHYGGSMSPSDVANSENFSVGTASFNAPVRSANGHSVTYITNPSLQELRDALNSGESVVAGMSANGGPFPLHYSDHWVVLRSVDGDSFRINDPEYAGAMNVSLLDHYSGWAIIEARIYH